MSITVKLDPEVMAKFDKLQAEMPEIEEEMRERVRLYLDRQTPGIFGVPGPYWNRAGAIAESAREQYEHTDLTIDKYHQAIENNFGRTFISLLDAAWRVEREIRQIVPAPTMLPQVAYAALLLVMVAIVLLV